MSRPLESTDKTQAIVLKVAPFSRTSHYVTWLTPQHGRMTTIIKGATRPKSAFLGQYDLFYTCELVYYTRDRNGVFIAKECSPIKTRSRLRSDWKACAAAAYIAETASRITVHGPHQLELFDLVNDFLDKLASSTPSVEFIYRFELLILEKLGYSPQTSKCAICGTTDITGSAGYEISPELGGAICKKCLPSLKHRPVRISAGLMDVIRRWQALPYTNTRSTPDLNSDDLLALRNILGIFLAHHVDVLLAGRKHVIELISA